MLQGLNLNNVRSINTAFERAARETCVLLDIPEATLRDNFTLYDGVTDYLLPTDIFASAVVDLRPQGQARYSNDFVTKQPSEEWDIAKADTSSTRLTTEYDKGTGILRVVSAYPTARIELDPMTATTGWVAAGTAATLTTDSTVYWQAPSSLRFNLTVGTGSLTKTLTAIDLTNYRSVGVGFLAFRTPSATNLTSVELRIGSSPANYYSVVVTTGFIKAFAANDWMLAAFDLSTATTVGTPVITSMSYVQINVVAAGTITNFYVGDLWISLPTPMTLIYQTSALFLTSGAATPSNSISNNNDQILLNDAAYSIYEVECALAVATQQGGTLANGVVEILGQKLNGVRGFRGVLIQSGLLDLYRADNPSQEIRQVSSYYDF